jgi:cell wall-associated NlpC family hydrolase
MSRHRPWRLAPVLAAVLVTAAPQPASAALSSLGVQRPSKAERPANPLAGAVAAARSHVGAGYAMGGNGPGAFDCSGLTTAALAAVGVALPRTSQAQFAAGRAVERDEIRAGDLVFFSTAGPGASHVGVATGRGTVISATSSGGVMEHSMSDAYWGSSYVGARRVSR